MINTTENCDNYKDRLLISGREYVPDEDFYRDIYYMDDSQIDCPEKKINLDDLKVHKKCLIELIQENLPKENGYKSKGCDVFFNDQLLGSYCTENEAEYALMVLQKEKYNLDIHYYFNHFDTLTDAKNYRSQVYIGCKTSTSFQIFRSIFNNISKLSRGEKPIGKSKDIEKAEKIYLALAADEYWPHTFYRKNF